MSSFFPLQRKRWSVHSGYNLACRFSSDSNHIAKVSKTPSATLISHVFTCEIIFSRVQYRNVLTVLIFFLLFLWVAFNLFSNDWLVIISLLFFYFCQNQEMKRWSSLQGPIAGGNYEAAFLQLSSILKCLDGMFMTSLLQLLSWGTHNIEAWLNSVPAAVWWIQSDTMPKHGLVSASFFDRVPLSASVKCSEMSTSIYLNDADDTKIISRLWYENRNDKAPHALLCIWLYFFHSQGMQWLASLICLGTVQRPDHLQNTQVTWP